MSRGVWRAPRPRAAAGTGGEPDQGCGSSETLQAVQVGEAQEDGASFAQFCSASAQFPPVVLTNDPPSSLPVQSR